MSIGRREQRCSEPHRRPCRLAQDLERGNVDEIAPPYTAQARIMKNIRLRFRFVWTTGWDAVDIPSEWVVFAFHPRFSEGPEEAKTSDAR
jgi:hypothetical protein